MAAVPTASSANGNAASVAPVLRLHEISKAFAETQALQDVSFELRRGEIHALLGENGAGKSTLIKVLAGVYQADHGRIEFEGQPIDLGTTSPAIGFIHQDLALTDSLTIAENFALVHGYPRRCGLVSWKTLSADTARALNDLGLELDPEELVSNLTYSEKARVAIARALALDVRVLVLDEPTASLPSNDVARLFDVLRTLRARGVGIVYVTHRLDEVFELADRLTVLRDGRVITTTETSGETPGGLVEHIVGRPVEEMFQRAQSSASSVALCLRRAQTDDTSPIDLEVRHGEIVALVGLRGAGHEAVGRGIIGDPAFVSGNVEIGGAGARITNPRSAIRAGIGFISSKRIEESLAPAMSSRENVFLNPTIARNSRRSCGTRREQRRAADVLDELDVRPRDPEAVVGVLSGGNQQKVVLARWLTLEREVLVLEEPTQGVDVGAKAQIYRLLNGILHQHGAILLVSSDFEEVAGIAHRAIVFNRGKAVAELEGSELTRQRLTRIAGGAIPAEGGTR
jgi:ribose transport system ATP-binding protein